MKEQRTLNRMRWHRHCALRPSGPVSDSPTTWTASDVHRNIGCGLAASSPASLLQDCPSARRILAIRQPEQIPRHPATPPGRSSRRRSSAPCRRTVARSTKSSTMARFRAPAASPGSMRPFDALEQRHHVAGEVAQRSMRRLGRHTRVARRDDHVRDAAARTVAHLLEVAHHLVARADRQRPARLDVQGGATDHVARDFVARRRPLALEVPAQHVEVDEVVDALEARLPGLLLGVGDAGEGHRADVVVGRVPARGAQRIVIGIRRLEVCRPPSGDSRAAPARCRFFGPSPPHQIGMLFCTGLVVNVISGKS